ncbi:nascent polypeptide-associated complex subunit alpha, muscle-specific form-like [Eriocheir sinensis]|uniref:nascent polypeptide-associated complex subunit alpha, muscle-specific form-like n=1 Tax=Eriocheir sinensis TaxID=95602 RepID=UPI0021C5CC9F|nr:nascent polypeptide-associated complex subunit alpha, muscle-specific form-like [Eriocheir sinensis]XP_050693348.1 nascent polypeptide-associated complex subunit alpha, muscle-specific form-like [Eriocheir sinensis]XP_050693349.1 nascent polypeptide-associated complex subunit alpha, muscle-specific form-like [Eriocheir sinensis]
MTPPSPLLVLLLVLAVGGPSLSPAHALPDAHTHDQGSYSFAYAVDAPEYKNFYDREEARLGQETRGRFRVALPDNRLQTVTYRADGNGYTASISYDQHPSFEALRQSVGPIRSAPEVGQSVLDGLRRGENWKHHKGSKDDARPELGSSLGGHGTSNNFVVPTPTPTRPRARPTPTPTRPYPAHPRPTPTHSRPGPSHTNTPVRTPRPSYRPRPSQRRPSTTHRPARPETTPRRTTAASSPPPRGHPPPSPALAARPSPTPTLSPRPFSAGDTEDSAILNRLIEAIKNKLVDDKKPEGSSGGRPHTKKPYSIADRESVRKRLEAVVHQAKY